jgi:pyruvate/2-oxoglutarate/acetoin dehydrogenase E1 component
MAQALSTAQLTSERSPETPRVISYAEAGVEGIREEMRRNPNILYMGQGVGVRGGNFQQSRGLWAEFGDDRVRDTPIAERAQTGLGIGAALAGSHPIVDIVFLDFTLERMFTFKSEGGFSRKLLFSNGVYGVRAVFCA